MGWFTHPDIVNGETAGSRHCFFAVWCTNTVHFQHDPVGRLLCVSARDDTNLWLSSFEDDRWNNATAVSNALGLAETRLCDNLGRPTNRLDAAGLERRVQGEGLDQRENLVFRLQTETARGP